MKQMQTQLLREHHLRTTSGRAAILSLFLQNDRALSHTDIEQSLRGFDRVTVYRTLKTFLESGMIHKVLDDGGTLKYALCDTSCKAVVHRHEHPHFKCERCGNTRCLEQVEIPALSLPDGYTLKEVNLLVQGYCPKCRKNGSL